MAKLSNRFGTRPQGEIFNLPDRDDNLSAGLPANIIKTIDVRPFIQNKRSICIINPDGRIFYTVDGTDPEITSTDDSEEFTPTSSHKNIQGFHMKNDMETLKILSSEDQHVSVLFYEA